MAVLAEALSVIVRRDSIDRKYRGGWSAFVASVPNSTFCTDGEIARVGFMDPRDVESFIGRLQTAGLSFLENGKAIDLAVADQQDGLTTECEWLEFGRLPFGEHGKVAACWLFEGPRVGAGMHMRGTKMHLVTPGNWSFEGSLSQHYTFVPKDELTKRLQFLRREDSTDVYLDLATGREVYIGRVK